MTDRPDTLRGPVRGRHVLSDDAIFCIFEDAARDAGDYVSKWWRDAGRAIEAAALAESDRTIAELRARCAELEADRERLDALLDDADTCMSVADHAWGDAEYEARERVRAFLRERDAARRQEPDDGA